VKSAGKKIEEPKPKKGETSEPKKSEIPEPIPAGVTPL
jgi:hypothetical protein